MTQKTATLRLASTAIAAAFAFSSNPLIAQVAPTPDPSATTPVQAAPDPLAPAPATVAPEPTVAPEAAPVAKPRAPATKARAAPVAHRPAPVPHTAPARAATAPAPAATPTAERPAPKPAPVVAVPPEFAATPAAQPAQPALTPNDWLMLGGAGAFELLVLAGITIAMRRRKRRQEELYADDQWAAPMMAETPAVDPQPASAPMAARHDPVDATAPVTAVPAGFDLSRFGPHVQAAYRGPTPDNPSLSLKYRLRRASAVDQLERREGKTKVEVPAPSPAPSQNGFIVSRNLKRPANRPAYTH